MSRARRIPFVLIAAFSAAVAGRAAAGQSAAPATPQTPARSTQTGVYTVEQATRGESTFSTICTGCHTTSTYTAPAFVRKWEGRPVGELYALIVDTMPEDAPGTLTPKEYAQVVAYLLKINRMPAGAEELPADGDALLKIRFETSNR